MKFSSTDKVYANSQDSKIHKTPKSETHLVSEFQIRVTQPVIILVKRSICYLLYIITLFNLHSILKRMLSLFSFHINLALDNRSKAAYKANYFDVTVKIPKQSILLLVIPKYSQIFNSRKLLPL
jgi:hypothetical protein